MYVSIFFRDYTIIIEVEKIHLIAYKHKTYIATFENTYLRMGQLRSSTLTPSTH